jgi:hypothetical protein
MKLGKLDGMGKTDAKFPAMQASYVVQIVLRLLC